MAAQVGGVCRGGAGEPNHQRQIEKVHCAECLVRKKVIGEGAEKRAIEEYCHQAVALVWASGEIAWPIGWELLKPGEGVLPAALRLLGRLLPRLSKSIDKAGRSADAAGISKTVHSIY